MIRCFFIVCFLTLKFVHGALNYLCLDSGHGGQTPDLDGDEDDGFDEGFLQPLSYQHLIHRRSLCSHLPRRFQEGGAHR